MWDHQPLARARAGRMFRSGVRRPAPRRLIMREKELRARQASTLGLRGSVDPRARSQAVLSRQSHHSLRPPQPRQVSRRVVEIMRARPGANRLGLPFRRDLQRRSPVSTRCVCRVSAFHAARSPEFLTRIVASTPAMPGLELKRRPGIGAKPSRRTALLARCRLRERIELLAATPKEENIAAVRRPPAGEPTCLASIPPAAESLGRDCAGVRWGSVAARRVGTTSGLLTSRWASGQEGAIELQKRDN